MDTPITLIEKINEEKLSECLASRYISMQEKKKLHKYKSHRSGIGEYLIEYKHSKYSVDRSGRLIRDTGQMKRNIRYYILDGMYHDIDISNCQPTILNQLFTRNGLFCKNLDSYCNNRSEILDKYGVDKEFICCVMFNEKFYGDPFFREINTDIYKNLLPRLIEQFPKLHDKVGKRKQSNKGGSFHASCLQTYENQILMCMYEFFISRNYDIGNLINDGLHILKQDYSDFPVEVLNQCENHVKTVTGFKIKLVEKPMKCDQDFLENIEKKVSPFFSDEQLDSAFQKVRTLPHDINIADFLYEYFKQDFYFGRDEWYYFHKNRWRKDGGHYLRYKITHEIPEQISRTIDHPDVHSFLLKTFGEVKQVEVYLKALKTVFSVKKDFASFEGKLDSNLHLLCFPNGVYDFKTQTFREGLHEDYIFHELPYDYQSFDENNILTQELLILIKKIIPQENERTFLLKDMASSLSGEVTEHMNILFGGGSNGKSFLMLLMEMALGDDLATCWSTALLKQDFDICAPNPELADGKGKRFINIQEGKKDGTLNMETVKKITGGDRLRARNLFENGCKFVIIGRIWLSLNTFPAIQDIDDGTWRRIRVILFKSRFTDNPDLVNESENIYLADENLKREIHKYLPSFMSLLIKMYGDYAINGNEVPQSVIEETENYKNSQDVVSMFFKEMLVKDEKGRLHMSHLYAIYNKWCSRNNFKFSRDDLLKWTQRKENDCYNKDVKVSGHSNTGITGFTIRKPIYNIKTDDEEEDLSKNKQQIVFSSQPIFKR